MDRPLLAAAQPVTGWRRWAVATVLLLGSVSGMKARAEGEKPSRNERAMAPAATTPTYSTIPDSMFLVQGVMRNRWGFRKEGVRVVANGIRDTTNAQGYFRLLLPKAKLATTDYIRVIYRHPITYELRLAARAPFDSTRTKPYHITLKKPRVIHNPGFF